MHESSYATPHEMDAPEWDPEWGAPEIQPDPTTLIYAARRMLDVPGCAAGAADLLDEFVRRLSAEEVRRFRVELRERLAALNDQPSDEPAEARLVPLRSIMKGQRVILNGSTWLVGHSGQNQEAWRGSATIPAHPATWRLIGTAPNEPGLEFQHESYEDTLIRLA